MPSQSIRITDSFQNIGAGPMELHCNYGAAYIALSETTPLVQNAFILGSNLRTWYYAGTETVWARAISSTADVLKIGAAAIPESNDDWIAGQLMFQDVLATVPVTAVGQSIRSWKTLAGRKLTISGPGYVAQLVDSVLTPVQPSDVREHFLLEGNVDVRDVSVTILGAWREGAATNCFASAEAPASARAWDAMAYQTIKAALYNGAASTIVSRAFSQANVCAVSVESSPSAISAYRNNVPILTAPSAVANTGAFRIGDIVGGGGAWTNNVIKRIAIGNVATAAASRSRLTALVPAFVAGSALAIVGDSNTAFCIAAGGQKHPYKSLSQRLADAGKTVFAATASGGYGTISNNLLSANQDAIQAEFALLSGAKSAVFLLTNDFLSGVSAAALLSAIQSFVSAVGPLARAVVVSPWNRTGQTAYNVIANDFRVLAAGTAGIVHVNGQDYISGATLAADGVHMTEAGNDSLGSAVLAALA